MLPTRFPDPEIARDVVDAAMLCGAITTTAEVPQLRRLVLHDVTLPTLAGLDRFTSLDELELQSTRTSRFDGIAGAPQLRHFTAYGVTARSIEPLSALR